MLYSTKALRLQVIHQGSGNCFSAVTAHGCTGCKFNSVGNIRACERPKTEVISGN